MLKVATQNLIQKSLEIHFCQVYLWNCGILVSLLGFLAFYSYEIEHNLIVPAHVLQSFW